MVRPGQTRTYSRAWFPFGQRAYKVQSPAARMALNPLYHIEINFMGNFSSKSQITRAEKLKRKRWVPTYSRRMPLWDAPADDLARLRIKSASAS